MNISIYTLVLLNYLISSEGQASSINRRDLAPSHLSDQQKRSFVTIFITNKAADEGDSDSETPEDPLDSAPTTNSRNPDIPTMIRGHENLAGLPAQAFGRFGDAPLDDLSNSATGGVTSSRPQYVFPSENIKQDAQGRGNGEATTLNPNSPANSNIPLQTPSSQPRNPPAELQSRLRTFPTEGDNLVFPLNVREPEAPGVPMSLATVNQGPTNLLNPTDKIINRSDIPIPEAAALNEASSSNTVANSPTARRRDLPAPIAAALAKATNGKNATAAAGNKRDLSAQPGKPTGQVNAGNISTSPAHKRHLKRHVASRF